MRDRCVLQLICPGVGIESDRYLNSARIYLLLAKDALSHCPDQSTMWLNCHRMIRHHAVDL